MTLSALGAAIDAGASRVQSAIRSAAERTGVDFGYLFKQAEIESGLRPDAKARTSSATGLYQFLDQTWMSVVKRHGDKHGLAWAADCIRRKPGGGWCIDDPAARQAVLGLRTNPEASSLMAAEFASDNRQDLEAAIGRPATATDLYMSHFLGSGGASKFLKVMAASPDARADAVMPAAARANRGVFYTADGSPRSLSQVYERFAAKMGDTADAPVASAAREPDRLPLGLYRALNGLGDGATDMLSQALSGGEDVGDVAQLALQRAFGSVTPTDARPAMARLAYLMLAELGD